MQSMQKHGIIVGILFDVKSYVFTVSLRIVDIKKKYIYDNRCVWRKLNEEKRVLARDNLTK